MKNYKGKIIIPASANVGISDSKDILLSFDSDSDKEQKKNDIAYLLTTESARSLAWQLGLCAERADAE